MGRPASKTSVLRPFSVSSFAAQPPVIPEPTIIASKVEWGICFSLCVSEPRAERHATVLRAGNDLQLQFLGETDFRGVIAVKGHVLEDSEEVALHLRSAARRFPEWRTLLLLLRAGRFGNLVHGAQENNLLNRRGRGKIFAEECVALLVHAIETIQKIAALFVVGPLCEDDIHEFVYASAFGARRVGCRDDLVDHGNNSIVLVRIQRPERIRGTGLRLLIESKKLRSQRRQNRSRGKQTERITPIHGSSLIRTSEPRERNARSK